MTEPLELEVERLRTEMWKAKHFERLHPGVDSCRRATARAHDAYKEAADKLSYIREKQSREFDDEIR